MTSRAQRLLETHAVSKRQNEDRAKDFAGDIGNLIPNFKNMATSDDADAGYLALALQHGLHAQLDAIQDTIDYLDDPDFADDQNAQRKLWLLKEVFDALDVDNGNLRSLDKVLSDGFADKWPKALA